MFVQLLATLCIVECRANVSYRNLELGISELIVTMRLLLMGVLEVLFAELSYCRFSQ